MVRLRFRLFLSTWLLRLALVASDVVEALLGLTHPASIATDNLLGRVTDWHSAQTEALRRRAVGRAKGLP